MVLSETCECKQNMFFHLNLHAYNNILAFIIICWKLCRFGKSIHISHLKNYIYLDKLKTSLLVTASGCFIALSILVLFIVHKEKHWLLTEHLGGNPYLLTWRVVKFAAQHNKPIRRSAFTYCESDYPSRLDFC